MMMRATIGQVISRKLPEMAASSFHPHHIGQISSYLVRHFKLSGKMGSFLK